MQARSVCFRDQIESSPPGIVCLTGGGGKTSLLFALAQSLAEASRPVICTTTTRMLLPQSSPWLAVDIREEASHISPPRQSALFAARPPDAENSPAKVRGYAASDIDELSERCPGVWLLVEADGAARRPLKAPVDHEPVIPSRTAIAIAVMGLSCMNKPFTADTVFRMERVAAITGMSRGDSITPATVARLAAHPQGMFKNVPPEAKRLLFCNQADLPEAEAAAGSLADQIIRRAPGFLHGIYVGSLLTKGLQCLSCPV